MAKRGSVFLTVGGGGRLLEVRPFTVDDAFIVARYAENLASGGGYAMNRGVPSDGVTGPLWLLPSFAAARVGGDPVFLSKALGLLTMAVAVFSVVRRSRVRRGSAIVGVVAAASLAPSVSVWAVAGLETGLATLCVTLAGLEASGRRAPRASIMLPCLMALPWLRPECLPIGVAFVVMAAARDRGVGRGALLAFATSVLGVALFRLRLFDALLPLAAHAKPAGLADGVAYALGGALRASGLLGLVCIGAAVALGDLRSRALAGALGLHLVAVAVAGGDWMPGHRLLVPILPLGALLVGEGAERVADAGRPRLARALVLTMTLLLLFDLALELPAVRASGETRETAGATLADALGERHERVALLDVGYLGRRSGVEVLDLGGITDPTIGRSVGAHLDKVVDPAYLASRDPDAILLHSSTQPVVDAQGRLAGLGGYGVERRVASMPWVREHFRVWRVIEYSPGYHYVWLARRAPR